MLDLGGRLARIASLRFAPFAASPVVPYHPTRPCVMGDSTVPLTASDCEPFVVKRTASRFGLVASMGQVSLPAHRSAAVTVPLCTLSQVSGGAPCHPFL